MFSAVTNLQNVIFWCLNELFISYFAVGELLNVVGVFLLNNSFFESAIITCVLLSVFRRRKTERQPWPTTSRRARQAPCVSMWAPSISISQRTCCGAFSSPLGG